MASVSLRGVRKYYDGVEVIHGVDCEIVDGEFIVILGPSGCGKSTLLRMIAGLEAITNGEVAIGARLVHGLEPKLRVQMRIEIKRLHQSIRTTSGYVTHDQVEAMALGDRLIVMKAGRAEQIGAPIDVYERPATTFVAGFIGSPAMNMLPARLAAD